MVTATEPGGSFRVIFREPPFSSASATNWLLTVYLCAPPILTSRRKPPVSSASRRRVWNLGESAGAGEEAQGVDGDAGFLGSLDHLIVLVGRVIGLAVPQYDQRLAVCPLLGELGDGIEARLVELRGQRGGLDGPHLALEIALGGVEIGEPG